MTGRRIARNALALLTDSPWAILPSALETMVAIARRENPPLESLEAEHGEPLEHTHAVTVRDGVARIPVEGPLFRRADYFMRISGATSYDTLATDLAAALADPAVTAVVFDIDSPGGEVAGCDELAGHIYAARGVKPLTAYVSGSACSAAYWIASACDEIVAAPTAILGSIGTCVSYVDDAGFMEKNGFRRVQIVSSQSPRKNLDPATDEGRSELQVTLDALAEVFVATVARNREVAVAEVLERYGQGGVMVGADAVGAGLADALGSYEEVVRALLPDPAGSSVPGGLLDVANATQEKAAAAGGPDTQARESTMAKRTLRAVRRLKASAGGGAPGAVDEEKDDEETAAEDDEDEKETAVEDDEEDGDEEAAEDDEDEKDAAEDEDEDEEKASAMTPRERRLLALGARKERERIAGIDKLAIRGHSKLVARAKAQGWSVNKTARRLLAAERERQLARADAFRSDMPDSAAPRGFAKGAAAESDASAAEFVLNAGKARPAGNGQGR